jgi:hypothetical protein
MKPFFITPALARIGKDEGLGRWIGRPVSPPFGHRDQARKLAQSSNAAGSLPDLAITETIEDVIIYHSDGLHVGINDRRTNETESAMLQVLAECIGFG